MEYENFDLWIQKKQGNCYKVSVIPPCGAEECLCEDILSAKLQSDLKQLEQCWPNLDVSEELRAKLSRLANNTVDGAFLKEIGAFLYDCLFRGTIRDAFKEQFGKVEARDNMSLRVRLIIDAPEIAVLPWELLYDRRRDWFLAVWDKTSVVRYLNMPESKRDLKVKPPVKVLVAIPHDPTEIEVEELNTAKEKAIVFKAFEELIRKELVQLDFLEGNVTVTSINNKLNDHEYHIFHFIGHGCFEDGEGYLKINLCDDEQEQALLDEREKSGWLRADSFANLFALHRSMKLIVLNSCQGAQLSSTKPLTGIAPRLFGRNVPAVVAMQYPLFDDSAAVFSREFYGKLCKGRDRGLLDTAIMNARNMMLIKRREGPDFATPVLFMRTSSGLIFDLEANHSRSDGGKTPIDLSIPILTDFGESRLRLDRPVSLVLNLLRMFVRMLLMPFGLIGEIPRLKALMVAREENLIALGREKDRATDNETLLALDQEIAEEEKEVLGVEYRLGQAGRAWLRLIRIALLVSFVILAAAVFGVFNLVGVDDYLQDRLSHVSKSTQPVGVFGNDHVRIILVDAETKTGVFPNDDRTLDRPYHAQLIDALSDAGAAVIAFDTYFEDATAADEMLASAIKNASRKGTQVVVGVNGVKDNGLPITDPPPRLKESLQDRLGNVNIGIGYEFGSAGFKWVIRHVELGKAIADPSSGQATRVSPSFILQAIKQFRTTPAAPVEPYFFGDENPLRIELVQASGAVVEQIPVVDEEMSFRIAPASDEDLKRVRRTYQEVYEKRQDVEFLRREYQNKIVLVGYETDDWHYVSGTRGLYGVEIHANVISNIFQNVYVKKVAWEFNLLIIFFMMTLGLLLQSPYGNRLKLATKFQNQVTRRTLRIPLGLILVTVLYFVVAYFVYSRSSYILDLTYHVAALFIAYLIAGYYFRKRGTKLIKEYHPNVQHTK